MLVLSPSCTLSLESRNSNLHLFDGSWNVLPTDEASPSPLLLFISFYNKPIRIWIKNTPNMDQKYKWVLLKTLKNYHTSYDIDSNHITKWYIFRLGQ